MTTKVTVDAHAGWPVSVKNTASGHEIIVAANTTQDFYVHSGGNDLLIHEVQPDENKTVVNSDQSDVDQSSE